MEVVVVIVLRAVVRAGEGSDAIPLSVEDAYGITGTGASSLVRCGEDSTSSWATPGAPSAVVPTFPMPSLAWDRV